MEVINTVPLKKKNPQLVIYGKVSSKHCRDTPASAHWLQTFSTLGRHLPSPAGKHVGSPLRRQRGCQILGGRAPQLPAQGIRGW